MIAEQRTMYELWDADSRNLVDSFGSRDEARDVIAAAVGEHGISMLDSIFLVLVDDQGKNHLVGEGRAILDIVRQEEPIYAPARTVFQFWDDRTNNLIDAFDSEQEALAALGESIRLQGESIVEHLYLVADDPDSERCAVVAVGRDLARLALNAT